MNGEATRRAGLAAALANLSSRDRLVLALVLVEGLSTAEAADVLGEPSRRVTRDYRGLLATLRRSAAAAPRVVARRRGATARKAA